MEGTGNLETRLKELGQDHILERLQTAKPEEIEGLRAQMDHLDKTYPGGLKAYAERGKQLLYNSKEGVNPYEAYKPQVPVGLSLDFNNAEKITHYETIGEKQMPHTAFVLVAGGLGERLGYKGIKVEIPIDTATHTSFLSYYIQYILAIQKKLCPAGHKVPLAIMTSDDTNNLTIDLLDKNDYFGLDKSQLTIMKQEKVPSLLDNEARFAFEKDKLLIETKPHGHGDIHTLLYQHQLTKNWQEAPNDIKWVVFFQDTNPLIFRSVIPIIGVSTEMDFDMNTVGIRRRPEEPVGAITRLVGGDGKELVVNVEYNQLGSILKAHGGEKVDTDGFSVLPGNTNILVFKLSNYHKVLERTKGQISEFINPKYADNTKTKFKSSARLECMMQDYPKLLESCQKVGFTMVDRAFCFSTVKNDLKTAAEKFKTGGVPESSSTCEADFYELNRKLLKLSGAIIEDSDFSEFSGIKSQIFPRVFLAPIFAVTLKQMRTKVKKLHITKNSTLIVLSDCVLEDVHVDGVVKIDQLGSIVIKEEGRKYGKLVEPVQEDAGYYQIRGYKYLAE